MPLRRGESILTPAAVPLGQANSLLLARARHHVVTNFAGPLSIKHVVAGRARWRTTHSGLWVDESSFLILNDGEPYSLDIDGEEEVETCCVFFETGFVESAARCLSSPEHHLLDDPFRSPASLPFVSRLHRSNQPMMQTLTVLRRHALHRPAAMPTEDQFLTLANSLLALYEEIRLRVSQLPASRSSTRLELLKRLERGREFLHSDPSAKIGLSQISKAACLSPFHFHRAFKKTFGTTPHSYLSSLRLERALSMLERGVPVTQTCFAVGFESLGSFSNLFHKRFGLAPSKIRKIR